MSVLTRNRREHEDTQKQIWRSKFEHYKEVCQNTTNPFKRRNIRRPPLIEFKKLPEYKYEHCFTLPVVYFLETALLFMINAENIQTWFFEEEFRGYFVADFTLEESTRHLVLRLMDRAHHPDLARDPVVDDFLDNITDVTYYFEHEKEKFPDTVKFALHILSLEGPIAERLQLHKDLDEIEKFINDVLGKKVFHFDDDEDDETPLVQSPSPTSPPYSPPSEEDSLPAPVGGGSAPEIIDLVEDDEISLKRKYDEIIDLTVSDDDADDV